MRVIVASVRTPFVHGGAEVHAAQLLAALKAEGHTADLVEMPFNPEPELIPDQMLACGLLDLTNIHETPVDRLIALKFPAYLIPHPHKVVWLLHQHRAAYDLYENAHGGLADTPRGRILRDIIRRADEQIGVEARAIFTNSRNVTRRLQEFSGTPSVPLYHPPAGAEEFYCADEAGDYFFFPSRLTATKRQELVIEALGLTSSPVRIKFSAFPIACRMESTCCGSQRNGASPIGSSGSGSCRNRKSGTFMRARWQSFSRRSMKTTATSRWKRCSRQRR
jgi:glycosyltransferase involved in cell wall biosynthesis